MTSLADLYTTRHTHSHKFLRKAVGWMAILLPIVLSFGNILIFKESNLEKSISAYYHTEMGAVFVGTLCALAMYMFYDLGYNALDDWAGNFAGFFAIGVAWFPPSKLGCITWAGWVHIICAILLFCTLAFISYCLFPKIDDEMKQSMITRNRKIIYKICGIAIFACLISLGVFYLICRGNDCPESKFVFWAESIALIVFGISWLTSGCVLSRVKK